jgi:hypothetical protein
MNFSKQKRGGASKPDAITENAVIFRLMHKNRKSETGN